MNISLDMCVEGATTCQGLARLADEVWSRAPVKTEPFPVLRVAVVSWCCNDHSTFEKTKGGRYKCKQVTAGMHEAARALRDRLMLESYLDLAVLTCGISIAPGKPEPKNCWKTYSRNISMSGAQRGLGIRESGGSLAHDC